MKESVGFKIICNNCGHMVELDKDYFNWKELEEKGIDFNYDEMDCSIQCKKCKNFVMV